ncbi:DGPFAETKE family protein [Opitutaceae bacterium TAV5]|nr:DGPFAETKE family protein [Opitutaceae bacterium TAV5]
MYAHRSRQKPAAPDGQPSAILHLMKTTPVPDSSPYLLFFRNTGPENYQHLSPDQRQQLVARWNAWYDRLVAQGKAVEGQPLETEIRLVSGRPGGGRVVDGPFPETKEAIGGYVKLLVRDVDEAVEIARQHPALEYGMQIEVRSMTATCHLGVTAGHDTIAVASGQPVPA